MNEAQALSERRRSEPAAAAPVAERFRILLVDPSPQALAHIAAALAPLPCLVAEAGDAEAALLATRQHPIDLLLLRLQSCAGDVLTACRQIGEAPDDRRPAVLALTPFEDRALLDQVLAAGVTDLLPIDVPDGLLRARVAQLLNAQRDARQLRLQAQRLRAAQFIARIAYWELDLRQGRFSWSPEIEAVFGTAVWRGLETLTALTQRAHPDDRQELLAAFERAGRGHGPVTVDVRIRLREGPELYVRLDASRLAHGTDELRLAGTVQDLTEQRRNEQLQRVHERLSAAYDTIRRDLEAAAELQRSLMPRLQNPLPGVAVHWLYRPAAAVGGDLHNAWALDPHTLAFYQFDVSGHGVPSAMLSLAVHKALAPGALESAGISRRRLRAPEQVLGWLNREFRSDESAPQYFTMAYGTLDAQTGVVLLAQAGHPPTLIQHADGTLETLDEGAMPVGLFADTEYSASVLQLRPGSRLILYSDGITDCCDPQGEPWGMARWQAFVEQHRQTPAFELVRQLEACLLQWRRNEEPEDDLSALVVEWTGR